MNSRFSLLHISRFSQAGFFSLLPFLALTCKTPLLSNTLKNPRLSATTNESSHLKAGISESVTKPSSSGKEFSSCFREGLMSKVSLMFDVRIFHEGLDRPRHRAPAELDWGNFYHTRGCCQKVTTGFCQDYDICSQNAIKSQDALSEFQTSKNFQTKCFSLQAEVQISMLIVSQFRFYIPHLQHFCTLSSEAFLFSLFSVWFCQNLRDRLSSWCSCFLPCLFYFAHSYANSLPMLKMFFSK